MKLTPMMNFTSEEDKTTKMMIIYTDF